MRMPPGYSSIASTKSLIEQVRVSHDGDDGGEPDRARHGGRRQRRDRARAACAYARDLGVGNLIAMLQIATLPADLTEKNLRLFASDVMPHLREQTPPATRQPISGGTTGSLLRGEGGTRCLCVTRRSRPRRRSWRWRSRMGLAETLKIASPIRGSWEGAIPELGKQAGIFQKHGLDLDIFYTQEAARRCRSSSPDRSTSG